MDSSWHSTSPLMEHACILHLTSEYNNNILLLYDRFNINISTKRYINKTCQSLLPINRYAAFWGYAINDELLRFLTVVAGEGFMMMGAFWFTLLRGEHAWKAYGVAALVYFGCTVDVGFISKTGWFTGEAGVWVDLTLSYITIITAQPWTIFM